MAASREPQPTTQAATGDTGGHVHRDAARTRQLLLDVARRRFAQDGYAATTVRDIAGEARVNVALISRYFHSKEGLFEACLAAVVEDLGRAAGTVSDLGDVPEAMARQVVDSGVEPDAHPTLLLLLRSSGDERAEEIRLGVLRRFSESLASAAGWRPDDPEAGGLLLRAQIVLAAGIGIAVLRSSRGLDPLASATEEDLREPLCNLVDALLSESRGQ